MKFNYKYDILYSNVVILLILGAFSLV